MSPRNPALTCWAILDTSLAGLKNSAQFENLELRQCHSCQDFVRYADTVGYHGDQEHHISPYRAWVIDAFIDNMPFDRFTQMQLAGDLLQESGTDDKIASGYNRLLQTSHEGGVQAKEYLAMYAADRVRNRSGVWLGGTVGCAQCHNHKFDPYTAKDFYSLAAFFADLDEAAHLKKGSDQTPTVRAPEMRVLTKRERTRAEKMTARLEADRDEPSVSAGVRRSGFPA